MRRSAVLLLFPLFSILVELTPAQATYQIPHWVVANGAARQTGPAHIVCGTAGQVVIGRVVGPAHIHEIGFWYQIPSGASALPEEDMIPTRFALGPSTPSPGGPVTLLRFAVPRHTMVSVRLYDVTGRQVLTLIEGEVDQGYHTIALDGDRLAGGVYFCRMTAPGFGETRRLVLVK